jgi:hypothetical protein
MVSSGSLLFLQEQSVSLDTTSCSGGLGLSGIGVFDKSVELLSEDHSV